MRSLRFRVAVGLSALLTVIGCAPSIEPASLTGLSKASADISRQAEIAFTNSNRLARDVSVDRFVRSGRLGLTEDQFLVAVSPDSIVGWQTALSNLEQYSALLASLVDQQRGTGTSNALAALGQQLSDGRTGIQIAPGIGATFASLGGALINVRAQARAREILASTDPHVQSLLLQMAASIGENDREELRGTVWSNWNTSFQNIQRSYALAAEARNEPQQRELVAEYLAGLERRDAQLSSLANLRSSLLTLAAAHGTAAAGNPASLDPLLASVHTRLEETKRLYEVFRSDSETDAEAGEGQ